MYLLEVEEAPPHRLSLVPMRIRRFRLERASGEEAEWRARTLDRESRGLGETRIDLRDDGRLAVRGLG